jgi:nucleoside-diphosphate-sugar epimerase
VHSLDVGDAYRLAVASDARGPFNVAAEPILDPDELARALDARKVPLPAGIARAGASLSWKLRLQPTPPGWLDMGLGVPLMDTARARTELGWEPRRTGVEALLELVEGMHDRAGVETPPLARSTSGPARLRELASGVGRRQDP